MHHQDEQRGPDDRFRNAMAHVDGGGFWSEALEVGDAPDAQAAAQYLEEDPTGAMVEERSRQAKIPVEMAFPEEGIVLRVVVREDHEASKARDEESEGDENGRRHKEGIENVSEKVRVRMD